MSDPTPSSENPEDDLKRKFREALERKQAHTRAGNQSDSGGGRNQHAQGPAGGKRTFRRKSG
ncbi:DUF5302 domain-containing protein [Amycolatopsis acidiphila]|uniref:DUF5302 domain-containing protein n=1 Tax=Amycolatopsis acidiphila TaxID=715473 RepID=A0A558AH92_9PSEU|nr:DUF5302 domain-containing protein [Amycolatopsis acidiphila]TVT23630.1 hypothetical protein FNH06_08960 [Amycolatopsis acidiphila]UIJ58616.1 DUF5302 domain-containing protein [Amycolatopsis acidiphila]GHG76467.1 hypothetical protein GCM10017788_41990 [Amycolatopsis acidiphila]